MVIYSFTIFQKNLIFLWFYTEHDPEMFSQAVSSKDSNLWYEAMKAEMDSMESNLVWDLLELPIGVKSIGCKWVFKIKRDLLGNLE